MGRLNCNLANFQMTKQATKDYYEWNCMFVEKEIETKAIGEGNSKMKCIAFEYHNRYRTLSKLRICDTFYNLFIYLMAVLSKRSVYHVFVCNAKWKKNNSNWKHDRKTKETIFLDRNEWIGWDCRTQNSGRKNRSKEKRRKKNK